MCNAVVLPRNSYLLDKPTAKEPNLEELYLAGNLTLKAYEEARFPGEWEGVGGGDGGGAAVVKPLTLRTGLTGARQMLEISAGTFFGINVLQQQHYYGGP